MPSLEKVLKTQVQNKIFFWEENFRGQINLENETFLMRAFGFFFKKTKTRLIGSLKGLFYNYRLARFHAKEVND